MYIPHDPLVLPYRTRCTDAQWNEFRDVHCGIIYKREKLETTLNVPNQL